MRTLVVLAAAVVGCFAMLTSRSQCHDQFGHTAPSIAIDRVSGHVFTIHNSKAEKILRIYNADLAPIKCHRIPLPNMDVFHINSMFIYTSDDAYNVYFGGAAGIIRISVCRTTFELEDTTKSFFKDKIGSIVFLENVRNRTTFIPRIYVSWNLESRQIVHVLDLDLRLLDSMEIRNDETVIHAATGIGRMQHMSAEFDTSIAGTVQTDAEHGLLLLFFPNSFLHVLNIPSDPFKERHTKIGIVDVTSYTRMFLPEQQSETLLKLMGLTSQGIKAIFIPVALFENPSVFIRMPESPPHVFSVTNNTIHVPTSISSMVPVQITQDGPSYIRDYVVSICKKETTNEYHLTISTVECCNTNPKQLYTLAGISPLGLKGAVVHPLNHCLYVSIESQLAFPLLRLCPE